MTGQLLEHDGASDPGHDARGETGLSEVRLGYRGQGDACCARRHGGEKAAIAVVVVDVEVVVVVVVVIVVVVGVLRGVVGSGMQRSLSSVVMSGLLVYVPIPPR